MLHPAAREIAETYLDTVEATLRDADPTIAGEVLEDVRIHMADNLEPGSTPADVRRIIETMGEPDSYADALISATKESLATEEWSGTGRVLGMPYDLRVPTAERIASQWWDPAEPKILVPRVFGVGWTVNFGAVAVRLGMIEPDAEDAPFDRVPDRTFVTALMVPIALTLSLAITYVVLLERLPHQLPVHWNLSGRPDAYWGRFDAFGLLFVTALLPTVWAVWSVRTNRPPVLRGAVIGAATLFAALSFTIWILTLLTVFTGLAAWWVPLVLILTSLAAPLGVFVFLSRAGRRAEIECDLDHAKERRQR
jgi:hypothetical protein